MRSGAIRDVKSHIAVHMIGRTPEFEYMDEFFQWQADGGDTYKYVYWQIGVEVTEEAATEFRDAETGDLYVYYQIVDGEWEGTFVSRDSFEKVKKVMRR